MGRIEIGVPISTDNMPPAYKKWFEDLGEKYPYRTQEVKNGEVQVVRVKIPVDGNEAIKHLRYGKITSDSSGDFLERTFMPRYSPERDEIILEQ